jgi:quercetin dioxygenase-like cupin family protein
MDSPAVTFHSLSLPTAVDDHLALAAQSTSGRSSQTIHGGQEHILRQAVVALVAGRGMDEHESPGEATLQVLRGRVEVTAGEATWTGTEGDYLVIPGARHSVAAVEDSVLLLTVALQR